MGAGGVGGYFGGRMAAAGCDVTFIARGRHLDAIRTNGLKIDSRDLGDALVHPASATDDPSEVGIVDYVIIGVKLWDTEAVGRAVATRPPITSAVDLLAYNPRAQACQMDRGRPGLDWPGDAGVARRWPCERLERRTLKELRLHAAARAAGGSQDDTAAALVCENWFVTVRLRDFRGKSYFPA